MAMTRPKFWKFGEEADAFNYILNEGLKAFLLITPVLETTNPFDTSPYIQMIAKCCISPEDKVNPDILNPIVTKYIDGSFDNDLNDEGTLTTQFRLMVYDKAKHILMILKIINMLENCKTNGVNVEFYSFISDLVSRITVVTALRESNDVVKFREHLETLRDIIFSSCKMIILSKLQTNESVKADLDNFLIPDAANDFMLVGKEISAIGYPAVADLYINICLSISMITTDTSNTTYQ